MKVIYFAWLRERVGRAEEDIPLPDGVATVGDLMAHLKSRGPEYENAFSDVSAIRAAIDQTHADHATPIRGAREVALFPPMTGG